MSNKTDSTMGMKLIAPPTSPRMEVIAAARRRGMSLRKIAKGLNISPQAVDQQLRRRERLRGPIKAAVERQRHTYGHVARKCRRCRLVYWVSKNEPANKKYCSFECFLADNRVMDAAGVRSAIGMRQTGMTWTQIGRCYGVPFQTVQKSIWLFLARGGLLTHRMVDAIWQPTNSEQRNRGRWGWLERSTGIAPEHRRE